MALNHEQQFLAVGRSASRLLLAAAVCAGTLLGVGCEKKAGAPGPGVGTTTAPPTASGGGDAPAPAGAVTKLDPASVANGATIKGTVKLDGEAPVKKYDMSQRPECVALHPGGMPDRDNLLKGSDGGLRDVFVQITGGLEKYSFDTPTEPVAVDQKGCVYVPHVFGIMANQDIKLINSDDFLHNVNVPEAKKNVAMPKPAERIEKRWFRKPKVPAVFQCEVHSWMKAYACVVDHPYYSVSSADGSFEIKGLPAGTYKVTVWHELVRGLKAPVEQEITVAEGETKEIEFVYTLGK